METARRENEELIASGSAGVLHLPMKVKALRAQGIPVRVDFEARYAFAGPEGYSYTRCRVFVLKTDYAQVMALWH